MVSVCMATYNGEKYIKEQINSILYQLDDDDELIISDDGSTDKTLDIIRSLEDTRITVLYHEKVDNPYSGPYRIIFTVGRNFENAIKAARGDYIFLSDQDDIWLPNRIRLNSEKLHLYDLVVNDCSIINDTGELLKHSYFYEFIHPSKYILRTIYKSSFHGCCMAFRKDLKSYILPFPDIPIGHDTWIGLVAIKNFSIHFLKKQTLLYRIHDSNLSVSDDFKSKKPLFFKILYRIKIIEAFLKIPVKHTV